MTTESDPPIIQADVPFNVEAVRNKSGGIDALAKRPHRSPSDWPDTPEGHSGAVDPSRHIVDTRARIASDDRPEPTPPCDVAADEPRPESFSENTANTQPPAAAPPASPASPAATTAPETGARIDWERRIDVIKSTNQDVARELEALQASLRPSDSETP